ncbi:hypothetical protein [Photobacterium marinum]|uniref:hypothetical protein n=1 Tax=Photobacterium marinum TaxID=1056511 RepID=UPI0012F866E6|nr:hypothetical protein [Photobacterium marinum]
MKKHSLYTHLIVTSVTCSMLFLLVITTSTLTGYTHLSSPFNWKTEVREISRAEEYSDEFSLLAAIPDRPLSNLSNLLLAQNTIAPDITSDKRQEQCKLQHWLWHTRKIENCGIWLENKQKTQLAQWHSVDLITFDLPDSVTRYPSSSFRLGGWKESNALYKAINGHPITA